jgi:hypothetical protein
MRQRLQSLGEPSVTDTDPNPGHDEDFEPLLRSHIPAGQLALVMSHVCRQGIPPSTGAVIVERSLLSQDGTVARVFPPVEPSLSTRSGLTCHRVMDEVSTAGLSAGDYVFTVALRQGDQAQESQLPFSVAPASTTP